MDEEKTCKRAEEKKKANEQQQNRSSNPVETLLQGLAEGKCKRVGGATAYRVAQFAAELGLI